MPTTSLDVFIVEHRDELIRRCREKTAERSDGVAYVDDTEAGVPVFLSQLVGLLRGDLPDTSAIRASATTHGGVLFRHGLSIEQVVHDYGDVCQSITELAVESNAPMTTDDFRLLNRCLDNAIADAVSEFSRQTSLTQQDDAAGQSLQLRNLLFTAITGFEALQTNSVGIAGNTGFLVHRSLMAMRDLL
jgi:hypothetical protein